MAADSAERVTIHWSRLILLAKAEPLLRSRQMFHFSSKTRPEQVDVLFNRRSLILMWWSKQPWGRTAFWII